MSTTKKPKTGSISSKPSGMLSTINQHFFPDKREVQQLYLYLQEEITINSCSKVIGDIISANLPAYWEDSRGNMIQEPAPDVINLLITSQGGDMAAAYSLINVIRGSKVPVRTIALGEASSAALCILMSGHQRVATPYTSLMSHQFLSETGGSYDEIKNLVAEFDLYYQKMQHLYFECTGLDEEFIKTKLLSSKDHYFSPEVAKEYNMVDIVSGLE